MAFTKEQIKLLEAPLDPKVVRPPSQYGPKGHYIEGWHAFAEANKIFGHDGWTRETVEMRLVQEKPRIIGRDKKDGWGVSYVAKVRVTAGGIVREGTGAGHGIDADLGNAHESAVKEAETDAAKRALSTFGWPFGLALYDKTREHVAEPEQAAPKADGNAVNKAAFIKLSEAAIRDAGDPDELAAWWKADRQKEQRREYGLTQTDVDRLKQMVVDKIAELKDAPEDEAQHMEAAQ